MPPAQRWFGDGERAHYSVHWLQPALWGPCSSLTAWRLYWDHLVFKQTVGSLGRSWTVTSRGTGRGLLGPGGAGPGHHFSGRCPLSPIPMFCRVSEGQLLCTTPLGPQRASVLSACRWGRRGAWLLELPLPGRPHCPGHQPQMRPYASVTPPPILVPEG